MTHAVVGLLDRATEERVRALRRGLASVVGTASLDALPLPHLSLVVSEVVDDEAVGEAVERVASTVTRVPILAEPWTVFTGPGSGCAVVRSVTRTPELEALRTTVADAVDKGMRSISPFTTTATWNPHVTLASQGVERDRLGEVLDHLVAADEAPWRGHIERLALVVEEGPRHRLAVAVELRPSPLPGVAT